MLIKPTLNLIEDKQKISGIVAGYLEKCTILGWKYEMALKILLDNKLEEFELVFFTWEQFQNMNKEWEAWILLK